ncbi:probable RNA-directed DNA polymerase from transposon X-element [Trichonephila clavipes]|uniref:Probable RNA-directed DNA polymerase from transposon X-element n=1 Tax=Trichonephila clavipes TaxID=2585209 RepID=A0A8X6VI29_TRICX|nr:probable RNA-directed DNA polymerase from transposon X-element [Trichonephila clavipes]
MIPKPGKDQKFPLNFRPISLISSIGKIYEKILLKRIEKYTLDNSIIPDIQHGFRKETSTCHQLLRATNIIISGFNNHATTGGIFLDVENAFDRLWHNGLIFKMINLNYPPYLIHTISDYLHNRTFQVKIQATISKIGHIQAGSPRDPYSARSSTISTPMTSPPLHCSTSVSLRTMPPSSANKTPHRKFGIASATIIDFALFKNLNWPCNIDSISELSSDHNPIKLHFPKTANFELPPPQLNTNWNVFTKTLASTENLFLPQANSTAEIESQVIELSSEILNAHVKASRPIIHSEPPFVQGELKHLFRERNKARKLWQFTRFPQHKIDLNRLQNKIKRLVGNYRQQVWEYHLTSLDAEDGSLWGTARAFRKKASPISALNGPNGIALSDSNKTDLIAQSLESQFQLNNIQNPQKDQIISSIVDAYINDHTNTTDDIQPALPSEIINYIKKIKIKKSPGRDGITNKMIKNLPLITVFKITNIINNMFKLRSFPNAWKTAVIIPILKPGKNPKLAESYRPISLLPILSKLAEKIISTRLNAFLENENILVPEQHGFRPRLSTSH